MKKTVSTSSTILFLLSTVLPVGLAFNTSPSKAVMPPVRQGGAAPLALLFIIFFFFVLIALLIKALNESRAHPMPKTFLKKCVRCGEDIPIASEECPYCGARARGKRRERPLFGNGVRVPAAIGVVIITALIIILVWYTSWSSGIITHSGGLVIDGNQTFTIQNCVYTQDGDIIVRDNGSLVIKEATLKFDLIEQQHSLIIMNNGTLRIEEATVTTIVNRYGLHWELNFSIMDHAQATIEDTWINSPIHCYDSSQISVYNSTVEVIDHRSIGG